MDSDDLTTRLLAAIDVAIDIARAATPGEWIYQSDRYRVMALQQEVPVASPLLDVDGDHIARNSPEIVLGRCEADREMVEDWRKAMQRLPQGAVERDRGAVWGGGYEAGLRAALIRLAEGYDLTTTEVPDGHHDH